MENDGFTLDDKRAKTDKNDILDIQRRFKDREKENPTNRKDKCFFVDLQEIKDNDFDLSIQKYKDIEYEEVKYETPEKLKKQILELEKDIVKDIDELEVS